MNITTKSFNETQAFGQKLARKLEPGMVICLYGDLGAGKTVLTQGIAQGLGMTQDLVSPTFIIIREYHIKHRIIKRLYHLDLYRIDSEEEVEKIGILEIFKDKEAVVVIEWAEKLGKFLPKKRIDTHIHVQKNDNRKITFSYKHHHL